MPDKLPFDPFTNNRTTGDFETLVQHIQTVGDALQRDARLVINRNVTARAWLTGLYIVEYEQDGRDRAKYGTNLLQNLSKRLGGKSYSLTHLRSYRLFYLYYPELRPVIGSYLSGRFGMLGIQQSVIAKLNDGEKQHSVVAKSVDDGIQQSLSVKSSVALGMLPVKEVSRDGFAMSLTDGRVKAVPEMVFDRLSFTHIIQLLHVEDDLQRAFYAVETMRGPWSVRELQRQIDSNYGYVVFS